MNIIQPYDYVVIKNFKSQYRRLFLIGVESHLNDEKRYKIGLKE